jgi:DNA-binding MarR family transcriptional regulator
MPANAPKDTRIAQISEQAARGGCTCGSLRKASRRISQFYDGALAPVGIKSTQFSILSEVERRSMEDGVTMCELALAMVMDRSTLGHNLRPLQRDGLLTLRLGQDDKRKRYVELTRKGQSVLHRAQELWRRAEGRFEEIFGRQNATELRAVLLNIANNKKLNSFVPAEED